MKPSFKIIIIIGMMILLFCTCNQVPKGIIQPHEMESLLVDVHLTEGIINNDNNSFYEKYQKETVMNYVFKKHNIDRNQFDASLVWYGKNQSIYYKIYEKVLGQLEGMKEMNDKLIASVSKTIDSPVGDTVDLWQKESHNRLTTQNGLNEWDFSLNSDKNYEPGDSFSLEFYTHLYPPHYPIRTNIVLGVTDQQDSTVLVKDTIRSGGWIKIAIALKDSSKVKRIFGRMILPRSSIRFGTIEMDSIRLMRYHPIKKSSVERIKTSLTDTIKTE